LGLGNQLMYLFPNNEFLNSSDLHKASALVARFPYIQSRMMADLHVGAGGGVAAADALFSRIEPFAAGAVNAETNAGNHGMQRALAEAADILDWYNHAPANLYFRTASFCTERSGLYDRFDQGISFFLPNQTWLQPPGWVHHMLHETFQPRRLGWSCTDTPGIDSVGDCLDVAFAAALSLDGSKISAWFTNSNNKPKNLKFELGNSSDGNSTDFDPLRTNGNLVFVSVLSHRDLDGANTPGHPLKISPVTHVKTHTGRSFEYIAPPLSFTSFSIEVKKGRP